MTYNVNQITKQHTIERFSARAKAYVESPEHKNGYDLNRLLELAQPKNNWKTLDIATGGGHTALRFAPFVREIIVSDITPQMLIAAEEHLLSQGINNAQFEIADAEALPFDDGSFDLATCRIAPHHFPDAATFVREAWRVLKPGGLFLMQDQVVPENRIDAGYVNAFEKLRDPSHHKVYNESEWLDMFHEAGFDIWHSEVFPKRHDFLNWAKVQDCNPATIEFLIAMLKGAQEDVLAWLDPQNLEYGQPSFVNRHIILAGQKEN